MLSKKALKEQQTATRDSRIRELEELLTSNGVSLDGIGQWSIHQHSHANNAAKKIDAVTSCEFMVGKDDATKGIGEYINGMISESDRHESGSLIMVSEAPGLEIAPDLVKLFLLRGHYMLQGYGYPHGTNTMRANVVNLDQNLNPQKANVNLVSHKGSYLKSKFKHAKWLEDTKSYSCLVAKRVIIKGDALRMHSYGSYSELGIYGSKAYFELQKEAISKYNENDSRRFPGDKVCITCCEIIKSKDVQKNSNKHNKKGCVPFFANLVQNLYDEREAKRELAKSERKAKKARKDILSHDRDTSEDED